MAKYSPKLLESIWWGNAISKSLLDYNPQELTTTNWEVQIRLMSFWLIFHMLMQTLTRIWVYPPSLSMINLHHRVFSCYALSFQTLTPLLHELPMLQCSHFLEHSSCSEFQSSKFKWHPVPARTKCMSALSWANMKRLWFPSEREDAIWTQSWLTPKRHSVLFLDD